MKHAQAVVCGAIVRLHCTTLIWLIIIMLLIIMAGAFVIARRKKSSYLSYVSECVYAINRNAAIVCNKIDILAKSFRKP